MDTSEHARIYEAIRQERDRLYAILDDDPQKAIDEARRLSPKQDLSEANIVGIKASIFIDGGEQLADGELVSEGIAGRAEPFIVAMLILFPALLTNCGHTRCLSHVGTEGRFRHRIGLRTL